jgi:hypothetical protein
MQQRRQRPGDIVDDYCPRERRITDHAIVAMVEEDVQRTRCVVCDFEHEFKGGRVPPQRKKKSTSVLFSQVLDGFDSPARIAGTSSDGAAVVRDDPTPADDAARVGGEIPPTSSDPEPPRAEEGGFRRSLIRAQLPRPEGQAPPARAIPEFTMHQPQHPRGRRHGRRPGHGQGSPGHRGQRDGNDFSFGPMRSGHGQPGQGPDRPPGRRRRRRGRKNR